MIVQIRLEKLGLSIVVYRKEAFLVEIEAVVLIVKEGVLPDVILIVSFAWFLLLLFASLHHPLLLNFDHFEFWIDLLDLVLERNHIRL